MNDVGLDAGWRIIRGSSDFFAITKKFHNALQGDYINLTAIKKKIYLLTNEDFSTYTHLNHDCVIIHDPQPLPMIRYYKKHGFKCTELYLNQNRGVGVEWGS